MIALWFLVSLSVTVLAEGCFVYLLKKERRLVYCSFLCNLLTNPALNLFLWAFVRWFGIGCYPYLLLILELCVVLAEGAVIRLMCRYSFRHALLISFLMNLISFLLGVLLYSIISPIGQ